MLVGIGRQRVDMATALRLVGAGQHHEAMALERLVSVITHGRRQEVELDVRPAQALLGADEATRLEMVAGAQAILEQQPAQADQGLGEQAHLAVQRHRLLAFVLDVDFRVVLQILAHPRQVVSHFDAGLLQHRSRTYARTLQQVRRTDGTGRHQHLAVAVDGMGLAALVVLHADDALAIEEDAAGHGVGDHRQVGPLHGRPQVGVGGGPAHAILHCHVHGAETFLHVAVAVVGLDVAGLGAGLHPGAVKRVLHVVAIVGGQGTTGTAVVIAAELVGLGALEVGQAIAVAPVLRPQGFPLVEVVGVATDVDQAIDGRGATEHLAARAVQATAVEMRLGHGLVAPVVLPGVHRDGKGAGHLDQHAAVAAAEFQDQHRGAGVLGQATGQDTAGGAGADDDVVVSLIHCCSPLRRDSRPRSCIHCLLGMRPSPGERPARGSARSGPGRPAGRTAGMR
ncbi:hypothetical protein D3C85_499190 [compost metagenome]